MTDLTTYAYKAQDASGKIVKDTIEASNEATAISKIKQLRMFPIEIAERDTTGLNREINLGVKRPAKLKDVALMTRQLSSMLNAGLPLIRALRSVEANTKNAKVKEALRKVAGDVESGGTLSSAMAKHEFVFPPIMVGMVKVGETGGFLEKSLEALADNLEDDVELRGKIKAAMAYPIVVSIMAVLGVTVMLLFVVPIFQQMFEDMGSELPLPTQILVLLSKGMPIIVPVMLLLFGAYFVLWPRYRNTLQVRKVTNPIMLKLPIIGKVYHKIIIGRFSKNLSTMLSAGVPLLQALTIVSETAGNVVLEEAINSVAEEVKNGKPVAKPMGKHPIFPNMLVQMVAVGEESGAVETMFENVANFYDQEVKATTDQLTSLIEPILIVGIGVVIGGMVIALYLPMFSMYGEMNAQGGG
jgi:type IV pilus assembly protein PilC